MASNIDFYRLVCWYFQSLLQILQFCHIQLAFFIQFLRHQNFLQKWMILYSDYNTPTLRIFLTKKPTITKQIWRFLKNGTLKSSLKKNLSLNRLKLETTNPVIWLELTHLSSTIDRVQSITTITYLSIAEWTKRQTRNLSYGGSVSLWSNV